MSFPEEYPTLLRPVSWNINEQYGIFQKWNSHCKTDKNNPYFFQNMLTEYVRFKYFNGVINPKVIEIIKYICNSITIKWTDEEFIITMKKIKDKNEKFINKFNGDEYFKLTDEALITRNQGKIFLKDCLNYLKDDYNKIVINCNNNKK